ncbi:hypothetical protein NGA_0486600 [Nannochloropsis gaditana CCMP526]|nr:hypothetical protein NGA_0486600 [Nannochloropsis gaditana CCMP526]EKU22304.1 hypothetical protein NGA_0486600 [Nannochloropsis gaditana CCMP526]|eukprot:XP_005854057.1 hypothetical protein NGA_0486600 [Nannochloropsis gaditana CCMP526]
MTDQSAGRPMLLLLPLALLLAGVRAWTMPKPLLLTRPSLSRSSLLGLSRPGHISPPRFPSIASSSSTSHLTRRMATEDGPEKANKLPMLLDVETRGGILFVSTLVTAAIFAGYNVATALGVDGLQAGIYISVAMTLGMVAWTFTYIFRVANKDMTYAKQLKNYEDAVLAKRLEELEEEEVEALMEEVEKEGANMKQGGL